VFAREVSVKEDEARIDNGRHQLLLYVEKSDGSFGPLQTGAYMATNYMDDFVDKRKKLEDECLEKLRRGDISPVGYYILLLDMTAADVAARARISLSKVKKHEKPEGFKKAPLEIIGRYADVFGIPFTNMFQVIIPREDNIIVKAAKTANPYLYILEISRSTT
jgi:hypothetical protein